jgi:hypothetical protein
MKSKVKLLAGLLLSVLAAFSSPAQSLAGMAGVWNGLSFTTPQALQPQFDNGLVTNISGHDAFGADQFQVHFFADGTFTNLETSGSMVINGQGRATIYPAGSAPISVRMNFAQDVLAGISTQTDNGGVQNEFDLLVRSPASLATNDLTGNWRMIALVTPQTLVQSFLPSANGNVLSDLAGLDNESVQTTPLSQMGTGDMTFNPDGTVTGSIGDPFSGTYSLGAGGECDLNITPSGGVAFTLTAFMNAGKDTLITLLKEDANNRQQVVLLTKAPTNAVIADLQGAWKVTTLGTPDQIYLTRNANDFVTAFDTSDQFDLEQQAFTAGNDGFLTGVFDGQSSIGDLTVSTDGIVTVTFTNLTGQVESHTGQLNAAKDCLALVEDDGYQSNFTLVTRSPNYPNAAGQDFGLIVFGKNIFWAAGTNRLLQASGALGGAWKNVSTTQGRHELAVNPTNAVGFYRVSEP